jgi:hypothetical protein
MRGSVKIFTIGEDKWISAPKQTFSESSGTSYLKSGGKVLEGNQVNLLK